MARYILTALAASLLYPDYVLAQGSVPGRLPILGYNSYNDIACSLNATWMEKTITAMTSKGLRNAGYQYFQVDCGWQGYDRLSNGSITYDAVAFPKGIKPVSDYARSLGFRWSMYTDQGLKACDTRHDKLRPGSLGYERQDALMFAAWNTEYVKVDNCYINGVDNAPKDALSDFPTRFGAMWSALRAVNIKNMLICQWGVPYTNSSTRKLQGPASWAPAISTSYRISDDIARGWGSTLRIYNQAISVVLQDQAGPGKIFDMDLLEVGNPGMTFEEQKTHFAVWATFKSALMVSTNVPQMTDQTLSILTNSDLIAVNQDSLGAPIKLLQRFSSDYDLFAGPLANGDRIVLLVDHSNTQRIRTISFADLGIKQANSKNLWNGQATKSASSFTQSVSAHGSIVLRLSNIQAATISKPNYSYYAASSGVLSNGASLATCSACATGKKVGSVSSTAAFTITVTARPVASTADVLFDYINCDISWLSSTSTNTRAALISVNGQPGVKVLFPITGYEWTSDVGRGWKVRLTGFKTDGSQNVIRVAGASGEGWAPDFDRIGVPI